MGKRKVNTRGVVLKKTALRRTRESFGWSQIDLAANANIVGMSAWRAENERRIDPKTARLIAKALKVPVSKLIDKSA